VLGPDAMSITAAQFAILGLAAFALTGLLTWPVRALAIRLGAMDAPNMARKTQAEPVPYLGGVAIALGVSVVTFGALFFSNEDSLIIERGLTAIIPALLLGLVGLVDDLRSLPAWPRLVVQTVIGTVIALVLVQTGTLGIAFDSDAINTLLTIFWIVGICNSINFFDNMDGAASGAVAIAALGVFFIAYDRGQVLLSALTVVTAGATIGFLMWNKSPAKIYMGDAGALFLGVIISVATIRLNPGITPSWQSLAIPVMLLAVPLLDTCVAVFSRIARGLSPLTGGKDHLSHRLVRSGLTRPMAAISLWAASGVCALFALGVYFFTDSFGSILIAVFAVAWLTALILFLRTPSIDKGV
jgi:UDP-GlcNAc:undecaprenyl-phosphate/decaprenyl-phosphate GlcNAc-1-phosphate transferase